MPRLFVMNLCHDIALAGGAVSGRLLQFERDLQPLARWLATGDDIVLPLCPVPEGVEIVPWGWDGRLFRTLGISSYPGVDLQAIKRLSSKVTAAAVLKEMVGSADVVGDVRVCDSMESVEEACCKFGRSVLKQPWSSSGRGLRWVVVLTEADKRWARRALRGQGAIVVQPWLNKVLDCACEFEATDVGVRFVGLSVFRTERGRYCGNLLRSQGELRQMITSYIGERLLDETITSLREILSKIVCGRYKGPLGVDMMVCSEGLMPCVEINMRQTMGLLAMRVYEKTGRRGVMKIGERMPAGAYPLQSFNPAAHFSAWIEAD